MKVIVKSTNVRLETFTKKDGKEVTLHKQTCALATGSEFPLPFEISVKPGSPYPIGEYQFTPETFRASRFGGIEINPFGVALVALSVKAVKAA